MRAGAGTAVAPTPFAATLAQVSQPHALPEHGVTVVFVDLGNAKLELLEQLGEASPIASFLQRNPQGGVHHICLGEHPRRGPAGGSTGGSTQPPLTHARRGGRHWQQHGTRGQASAAAQQGAQDWRARPARGLHAPQGWPTCVSGWCVPAAPNPTPPPGPPPGHGWRAGGAGGGGAGQQHLAAPAGAQRFPGPSSSLKRQQVHGGRGCKLKIHNELEGSSLPGSRQAAPGPPGGGAARRSCVSHTRYCRLSQGRCGSR